MQYLGHTKHSLPQVHEKANHVQAESNDILLPVATLHEQYPHKRHAHLGVKD